VTRRRERFRGFTSAATTGAAGGRELMHRLVRRRIRRSHMCHFAEYERATPSTVPPATGGVARHHRLPVGLVVDVHPHRHRGGERRPLHDSHYPQNCDNWTATMDGSYPTTGTAIAPKGAVYPACSEAHVVACCQ